eukprot:TRINITY_DN9051_c2_g1_i1.p1 TRINITY_DN9051_c2_g1~~TRINITY_DN9051_c2_g1_i1.p1  ORF type:complete len:311 (-),score=-35.38 TRINITY_DN9051_c2_g1_i1:640-1572(-)
MKIIVKKFDQVKTKTKHLVYTLTIHTFKLLLLTNCQSKHRSIMNTIHAISCVVLISSNIHTYHIKISCDDCNINNKYGYKRLILIILQFSILLYSLLVNNLVYFNYQCTVLKLFNTTILPQQFDIAIKHVLIQQNQHQRNYFCNFINFSYYIYTCSHTSTTPTQMRTQKCTNRGTSNNNIFIIIMQIHLFYLPIHLFQNMQKKKHPYINQNYIFLKLFYKYKVSGRQGQVYKDRHYKQLFVNKFVNDILFKLYKAYQFKFQQKLNTYKKLLIIIKNPLRVGRDKCPVVQHLCPQDSLPCVIVFMIVRYKS